MIKKETLLRYLKFIFIIYVLNYIENIKKEFMNV